MSTKASSIYIIMGVSASGKTTLGKALSEALNLDFLDGDDFHPPENIRKMSIGIPLHDQDRELWLQNLNRAAHSYTEKGAVIACSALKEKYRTTLAYGLDKRVEWIVLFETFEFLESRIRNRKDHFMPPALLKSQFDILELPNYGTHLSARLNTSEMLAQILDLKPDDSPR